MISLLKHTFSSHLKLAILRCDIHNIHAQGLGSKYALSRNFKVIIRGTTFFLALTLIYGHRYHSHASP